jgi:hypothetical protein
VAFPRDRPVRAVLEHLDRITATLSPHGFTVPEVSRRCQRAGIITNVDRIRAIFSAKLYAGRLERPAPGVYKRIPGVPLTMSLPKGLVRTAVYEALSSGRKADPWLMREVVTFVAEFTGRPRARIRTVVSNALDSAIRRGTVVRTGDPGRYGYSRARR